MNIRDIFKTKRSKINFLLGLIKLSKADGNFDENEKEFFRNFATVLGLDDEGMQLLDLYASQDITPVSFETKHRSFVLLSTGNTVV